MQDRYKSILDDIYIHTCTYIYGDIIPLMWWGLYFYYRPLCAHHAGDVTIIQYIVYSMLIGPIYKI